MIFAKTVSDKDINKHIDQVNEILKKVFVEEKKYKEEEVFNIRGPHIRGQEKHHVLLYEDFKEEELIGYGRLIINNDTANIMWVAVKQEFRGRKYGDLIIRMLIDKARTLFFKEIYVDLPHNLVNMFEKIGFYRTGNIKTSEDYQIRLKYKMNKPNSCRKNHNNVDQI